MSDTPLDDDTIVCDEAGPLIRRDGPSGSKRIPHTAVKPVKRMPIRIRKWRLSGRGAFRHSWSLDPNRPRKNVALELDTRHWIRPTITPDDVGALERTANRQTPTAPGNGASR